MIESLYRFDFWLFLVVFRRIFPVTLFENEMAVICQGLVGLFY